SNVKKCKTRRTISMAYDLAAVRRKLKQSLKRGGDPDEFKPDKAKDDSQLNYKFFILPPLVMGETCKGGKASKTMDQFFITAGTHWVRNKPYGCPKASGTGDYCPLCDFGFDLF